MKNYKGLFTFDVDNHKYVSVGLADGIISDTNYCAEAEEPKVGYIIDPMEEDCVAADNSVYAEYDIEKAKELGIWFGTKEETEKAVERLRALKRLKDKGFRFNGWIRGHKKGSADIAIASFIDDDYNITDDLDLLFCTEEDD